MSNVHSTYDRKRPILCIPELPVKVLFRSIYSCAEMICSVHLAHVLLKTMLTDESNHWEQLCRCGALLKFPRNEILACSHY